MSKPETIPTGTIDNCPYCDAYTQLGGIPHICPKQARFLTPTHEFPLAGQGWRHYKGALYRIEAIAHETTHGDAVVVYRGFDHRDQGVWVRPLDEFLGYTDNHERRFIRERDDCNA